MAVAGDILRPKVDRSRGQRIMAPAQRKVQRKHIAQVHIIAKETGVERMHGAS